MLVDIGEMKRHIKPKADSTLRNMRKDDLIQYIRCLENNYNVAVSFNENQAKYIESLDVAPVVHGTWGKPFRVDAGHFGYKCSVCGFRGVPGWKFCPKCGAKMDSGENM